MRLVLASASPRRLEILRSAGFDPEVLVVDVDERVRPGERPADYVLRLAREKSAAALAAWQRGVTAGAHAGEAAILGADTTVVVDGCPLGKPRDDADAAEMLSWLSGRAHEVLTGVSLRYREREYGHLETSRVVFAELTPDELAWYARTGEGRDKAGAYAIQGLASRFVTRIEGSYSNVVGLPAAQVYQLLREAGVI